MKETYYRLREKEFPKRNGVVLKITDNQLELFAGEGSLEELSVSFDKSKGLDYPDDYFLTPITNDEAIKFKEECDLWILHRSYM